MRIKGLLGLAAVAAAASASCSGDGGSSSALRPASEARSAKASEGSVLVDIGKPGTIGSVSITVSRVAVSGDASGPWLEASVHVENTGKEAGSVPQLAIFCTGEEEGGGYQVGSTIRPGKEMPPRTYEDGVFNLLLPNDSRARKAVPECAVPAFVRAEAVGVLIMGREKTPQWRVPDETIAELNRRRLQ